MSKDLFTLVIELKGLGAAQGIIEQKITEIKAILNGYQPPVTYLTEAIPVKLNIQEIEPESEIKHIKR